MDAKDAPEKTKLYKSILNRIYLNIKTWSDTGKQFY